MRNSLLNLAFRNLMTLIPPAKAGGNSKKIETQEILTNKYL